MSADISLKSQRSIGYWIHSVVVFVIMIIFWFLPAPEPLTQVAIKVVGIFLAMLYGWMFADILWPSIVGLCALGLSGYSSVNDAFMNAFGNNTLLMVLFIMAYCGVLDEGGILKWAASKIVSLPITKGRPWILSTCIMVAMAVLSLATGVTASTLLMWAIMKSIIDLYGFEKGEKWPIWIMAGLPFCGSMAFAILPFKNLPALVLGSYETLSGRDTIPFFQYFLWQTIVAVIVIALYLLIMRFVIRPDVSKIISSNKIIEQEISSLNKYQKMLIVSFILFLFVMLAPSILPKEWWFVGIMNTIGTTGWPALFVAIIVAVKCAGGPGSLRNVLHNQAVSWDLIAMVAAAMSLAAAMQAESTGINEWLVSIFLPLINGKSGFICMVIVLLAAGLMTQVANNLATAVIFTPVAYNLALASGDINISALMLCLVGACNVAFLTPSGCAPAALVHAEKDWIPGNNAVVIGLLAMILNLGVCLLLGVPLASILL